MNPTKNCRHCHAPLTQLGYYCCQCGRSSKRFPWQLIMIIGLAMSGILGLVFSKNDQNPKPRTETAPWHHRQIGLSAKSQKRESGPLAEVDRMMASSTRTKGHLDQVIQQIDVVLQQRPELAYALRLKANLLFQKKDYATAIPVYKNYLALVPDDAKTRLSFAKALFKNEKWEQTLSQLDVLRLAHPNYEAVYRLMAQTFEAKGQQQDASEMRSIADELRTKGLGKNPAMIFLPKS